MSLALVIPARGTQNFAGELLSQAKTASVGAGAWTLLGVALVMGVTFFLTEHSLDISQVDAYTQTAEEMELAAGGGNLARRVMFLALACMGLCLLATSRGQAWNVHWPLTVAMAGYLLVSFASYFWSSDPSMSLRRLLLLLCCVAAAAGIARRFSMRDLCLLTVAMIGPIVVLGLAAEIALGTFRPWSGDYRFAGSVHPNTQNMYLTALGLAALALARGEKTQFRYGHWAVLAAAMFLSVLTKSRTGNASTLLALGSVFLLNTPLRLKLTVGLAATWLGLVSLWLVLLAGYDPLADFSDVFLLGRAEQADSLSGRAFIWPVITYYIGSRPWLGYGYEAFWNPAHIDTISEDLQWGIREAHNGYLEVLLSTGIVGLGCGVAAALLALAAAARGSIRLKDPAYSLPLGLVVFGILSSFMESGMVAVMLPPLLLACCLMKMALFADQSELADRLAGCSRPPPGTTKRTQTALSVGVTA